MPHSKRFKFRGVSSLNFPEITKICLFLFIPQVYPFFLQYPLSRNLENYWRESVTVTSVKLAQNGSLTLASIWKPSYISCWSVLAQFLTGWWNVPTGGWKVKRKYEFVGEGVHQVIEMERHLEILVTNEVFVVLQCQVCLFCFFLSIKIFWIEIRKVTTMSINCP